MAERVNRRAAQGDAMDPEVIRRKLSAFNERELDKLCRAAGIHVHPLMRLDEKVTAMVAVYNTGRRQAGRRP